MLYLMNLFDSNLEPLQIIAMILAYFLAICVAMSFHEWAHSFAAYKCGDDTPKLAGRLTLNPFAHFSGMGLLMFFLIGFGWAKPVQINPTKFRNYKKGMILTSLSGVLTNLLLAFVFSGLFFMMMLGIFDPTSLLTQFFYYFFYYSLMLNLVLFVFNLLPIPPLDGYNFISIFTKYNNKVMMWLERYSFLIILFLILPIFNGASLLSLLYDFVLNPILNLFLSFWGLFV